MIRVIQPGLLTTVQDEGRSNYLAFGMPRAGFMDRYAARMANLLCGNPLAAAVLEMTIIGGSYCFESAARIAVCGATMPLQLNGEAIAAWSAVDVSAGDVLELGAATAGCRSYLAVAGGVEVPLVMGSRSTYYRAGIGGFLGRALKSGDQLFFGVPGPFAAAPIQLPADWIPEYPSQVDIRVMTGPQAELFSSAGMNALLTSVYTVSNEADRMGYRLEGEKIEHLTGPDIVSDALTPGAIQVPGSGQPIVMMVDCGTTGGYAKIATVIGSDLAKVAQTKPQDSLRFVACTDEDAVQALQQEMDRYRQVAEWAASGEVPAVAVNVASPEMPREVLQEQTKNLAPLLATRQVGRKLRLHIAGKSYEVEIEEVK
jgi:biotin-dependent carboxylase-like uncharacterized protein